MKNDLRKIISNNIKTYMDIKGISQSELARILGVTQSTVSLWISGEREPRISKIDELCRIFDCTRSDFLSRTQNASSIQSASLISELDKKIHQLNDSGINKVCEYIDDLSDKYRI